METMQAMEAAVNAATSPAVKIWLNWMVIIFLSSVVFVWKNKSARIVLAAFLLTLPLAMWVFAMTQSAHMIGLAHILVWGPLAYFLYRREMKSPAFRVKSIFGVWLILLLATIVVSLLFDVRDVTMVLLEMK